MLAALRPGGLRPLSGQTGVAYGYIGKARQVFQWCDTDPTHVGAPGAWGDAQPGQCHHGHLGRVIAT